METKKNATTGAIGQRVGKENLIKRQATPSQVRANHERQRQQQQHQRTNGKQAATVAKGSGESRKKTAEKQQINAKVKSLHEKTDKSLDAFSRRAAEIKGQIGEALERQDKFHAEPAQQPGIVETLRESLLELEGTVASEQVTSEPKPEQQVSPVANQSNQTDRSNQVDRDTMVDETLDRVVTPIGGDNRDESIDKSGVHDSQCGNHAALPADKQVEKGLVQVISRAEPVEGPLSSNCFEPLTARLDRKSKYIALRASLEHYFVDAPHLLEPICDKFIHLTDQLDALAMRDEQQTLEIQKLTSIKDKLSELCRELQKSNNQVRIESLEMIRVEQNKAKEQAGKIQSTLSGVMKLFDENQQRNFTLKQENVELQGKLKGLLEHCDNWEKCVETTLKQREIENRLAKSEMARLNLTSNDEKEKFFKEKSELINALTTMRKQQSKIEDKEAKLRNDLTNYASKYDECQEIIHKGLAKFQVESKRMLKQIEQGRRDYIQLLNKYEASNKRIKQLLEDKQSWAESLGAANNKLEALERLCRALKSENDRLSKVQQAAAEVAGSKEVAAVLVEPEAGQA